MKEILKIHFTLYPEGCEVREDELETDRIVLLSDPNSWANEEKFEMDSIGEKLEDYRCDVYNWDFNKKSSLDPSFDEKQEKVYYKYIVKNPFVIISIETLWLGFQDNDSKHEPFFSEIDWWQECTSYQETFQDLPEWIINNFKPIIDKNILENPKLNPPFDYVALVDVSCNVFTSRDWESGILDVDCVEIVPNKIIELQKD